MPVIEDLVVNSILDVQVDHVAILTERGDFELYRFRSFADPPELVYANGGVTTLRQPELGESVGVSYEVMDTYLLERVFVMAVASNPNRLEDLLFWMHLKTKDIAQNPASTIISVPENIDIPDNMKLGPDGSGYRELISWLDDKIKPYFDSIDWVFKNKPGRGYSLDQKPTIGLDIYLEVKG